MTNATEIFPDPANPSYSSGIAETERTPAQQAAYEEGVRHAIGAVEDGLDGVTDDTLKSCLRTPIAMIIRAAIDAACLPEPEEEIEVTPAMLQAGIAVYREKVSEIALAPHALKAIWIAMERQRRKDEAET